MSERAVWVPRQSRNNTPKAEPLTPEQVAALQVARQTRRVERSRRSMEARRRAWMLLADAHPTEFAALLDDMEAQIADERGPLPVVDKDSVITEVQS